MKIYTKGGDKGKTSLFGGDRVLKSSDRIHAYGTVDELNSWIGLLRDSSSEPSDQEYLLSIQHILFVIGAQLADGRSEKKKEKQTLPDITEKHLTRMEEEIDRIDQEVPSLKHFILPGGHPSISHCHIARCVCRRAERYVVALYEHEKAEEIIVRYLNRLSDYLFMLARKKASQLNVEEIKWETFS